MARPREFEPTEALNQAMRLFWQKGYLDTSMEDLVQATGVSRYGFYSAFGDKHELFLKAVAHYADTAIHMALSPLETAAASLPEIHRYFDNLLTAVQNDQPALGCLIGNTAMELADTDGAIAACINNHYTRMRAAFHNALQNAARRGDIPDGSNVEALADYLVGIANGYLACIRAGMTPEAVEHFIRVALERLD